MNETPRGERVHIGIFGKMGAGKSSLLNAITGQDAAVVSPVKGTTTDPVYKAMELLPIGPVVFIDTPGIDDTSELGELRIEKARNILRKTDIALLVLDSCEGADDFDNELIRVFDETGVPYLIVYNKCDLATCREKGEEYDLATCREREDKSDLAICREKDGKSNLATCRAKDGISISVSSVTGENIFELKEMIAKLSDAADSPGRLVGDLLAPGEVIVLVVPIDSAAPKGRLILPQQQVIRDALEAEAIAVITQPQNLTETLSKLNTPPRMVITDSQAFATVSQSTPPEIGLTSFSILMARYKGVLDDSVQGVKTVDSIKDGDKILIAEGCTHHRQCDDIGTVKLPNWIRKHTNSTPEFEFSSGGGFPTDLTQYKLIIHCGGCMQNPREMRMRYRLAREAGVPITNFGIAISHMQGILERCIGVF